MSKKERVFFLSSLFPKELEEDIYNNSIGAVANANNTLQWNILHGLSNYHSSIYAFNFPNVGAYPTRYKKPYLGYVKMYSDNKIVGESVSFINLLYFKHGFKYNQIKGKLNGLIEESCIDDKFIFYVYDLYPPFLKAISEFKIKNKKYNIYVCLIVPDLIGKTGGSNSFLNKLLLSIDESTVLRSLEAVDTFVLLSDQMKELLPINDKRYTVVEGIFNDKLNTYLLAEENKKSKVIFYSGALDERNGVLNLLKAFQGILDKNYRLVLCGDGALKNEIIEMSKKDSRIEFKGQLPRDKVLELQKNATLLVNPKLPGQDFTKYSFPSKTMEYFASGRPVLMYKLEGVPEEYFEHCFWPEDNTVDILRESIVSICNKSLDELNDIALSAQNFILTKKNALAQCKKIYNLVLSEDMK